MYSYCYELKAVFQNDQEIPQKSSTLYTIYVWGKNDCRAQRESSINAVKSTLRKYIYYELYISVAHLYLLILPATFIVIDLRFVCIRDVISI